MGTDPSLFASPAGMDAGITLWWACDPTVLHNTVASTQDPLSSSIEWRFEYTDADITNNLVTHRFWRRDGATARLLGNLDYQPLSLFADGPGGDLHLNANAAAAIDQGVPVEAGLCDHDIDGDLRPIGAGPDVGADGFRASWRAFLPMTVG